jgi:hypothetical protein
MKPDRLDDLVSRLVTLESYRSPWIPTRRLGRPALIGVAASRITGPTTMSEAPLSWYAVDERCTALLAFAATSIVSPVASFTAEPVADSAVTMHPRDAHRLIHETRAAVTAAFFHGQAADQQASQQLAAAYRSTIPARLLPWVRLCCADFFEWLEPGPARTL